jgi:hypothetical protein
VERRRGWRTLLSVEEERDAWGELLGALGLLVRGGATVLGSWCCAFSVGEVEEKEKREKKRVKERKKEKEKVKELENFPNLEILGPKNKRQFIDLI